MEIRLFSYHSSFVIFILEQMCGMLSMLLYQLLVNGDEMSLQCTFIGNSETQLVTGVLKEEGWIISFNSDFKTLY